MSVQVAGTGVKAWPSPRHRWSAGFTRRAGATRSGTPSRLTSRTKGPKRHSAAGPSVRAFAKGGSHEADATRLIPPTTRPRDASHPRPRGHHPRLAVWIIPSTPSVVSGGTPAAGTAGPSPAAHEWGPGGRRPRREDPTSPRGLG